MQTLAVWAASSLRNRERYSVCTADDEHTQGKASGDGQPTAPRGRRHVLSGRVSEPLEALCGGEETLLVIRSDWRHYPNADLARHLDQRTFRLAQLAPSADSCL